MNNNTSEEIEEYIMNDIDISYAVRNNNINEVREYINNNGDVNIDNYGWPPLHDAAIRGYHTIVEYLIAGGADVNIKNIHGLTPMHYAAMGGHHTIVEYLIANGADVNIKTKSDRGYDTIVEYLIANGANVNIRDDWEQTPLDYATNAWPYTAENIPNYINTVNILLPLTNLSDINDIYKLYKSKLNTEVEGHKGIINELMMNRDDERCFIFCQIFNIGTNSVEDNNNKQEKNSLMIGYDAPLDVNEARKFPPMFDSNSDESLFDATLVSEIWKYASDLL